MKAYEEILFMNSLAKKFARKKPFIINSAQKPEYPFLDDKEVMVLKKKLNKNGWDLKSYEDNYQTRTYEFKPLQMKESNTMKKCELQNIIKEEIKKVLKESVDVDYWLGYRDKPNTTQGKWETNAGHAVEKAIRQWNSDSDALLKDNARSILRKFADNFIKEFGMINASIILAYISQELKDDNFENI